MSFQHSSFRTSYKNHNFDIYTSETHYLVQTELAGVRPEDIEVYVERDQLVIQAKRTLPEGQLLIGERAESRFSKRLRIDPSIDTQNIQAHYENGRLSLTLAKHAKRIEVKIA